MWNAAMVFVVIATTTSAYASCDLDDVVGYTLVAHKVVEGVIDAGKPEVQQFDGCQFDRVLVFTDRTGVRCTGYSYHYSYRPNAYIFVGQYGGMKACIDDQMFDLGPLQ